MDRRSTSPRSSGSLRRSVSDAAGLVTLWGWIGARVLLDGLSSLADRVAASTLSTVVGSEPIDPDALDWALRNISGREPS